MVAVTQLTTGASLDVARVIVATSDEGLFLPYMVGRLEGQFLKMFVQMARSKTVLDGHLHGLQRAQLCGETAGGGPRGDP